MIGNIYKLTSPSGKCYIGQTRHFKKRMNSYKHNACVGQAKLRNSLLRYGFENFKVEILFEYKSDNEDRLIILLDAMEKFCIKKYRGVEDGYNLRYGGSSYKCTPETRAKFSANMKNRSPELLEQIRLKKIGSKHSAETKLKMSKSHSNISEETRSRISLGLTGRRHSPETIKKLSESKLNMSEETKRKIAAWHVGRKRDDSTLIKLRENSILQMKPVVQLTIDFNFISEFESIRSASVITGIPRGTINYLCNNQEVKTKKFRWMFLSEYNNKNIENYESII